MPGTETPESHTSGESGECFVFAKYVIKTNPSEDGGATSLSTSGERPPKTRAIRPARRGSMLPIRIIIPFLDCRGNICLSIWGHRSNLAISLSTTSVFTSSVLTQGYTGDPKLIGGRFLMFDSPSDKKGLISTCKEAGKWKRQGGGVGWVQGKKLDLQTLTAVNVGTLKCVYME